MKYFVWVDEQQQGPFDEETIQIMVSDGQVTAETMICFENGGIEWLPAKQLFPQDFFTKPVTTSKPYVESYIESERTENPAELPDDGSRLEIRLISSAELKIKAIRLYDEIDLTKLNQKKAEAMKLFQGVSTGLGAIGSIEWVLAASVVIGAAEATLSAGASSAGARLFEEVTYADQRLRENGVFIFVGTILQIEFPVPGHWRVPYRKKEYNQASKTSRSAFVHNGDDFISAQTNDGSVCSIRWSAIEHYVYVKSV